MQSLCGSQPRTIDCARCGGRKNQTWPKRATDDNRYLHMYVRHTTTPLDYCRNKQNVRPHAASLQATSGRRSSSSPSARTRFTSRQTHVKDCFCRLLRGGEAVDANTIDDGAGAADTRPTRNGRTEGGLSPLLDNRDQPEHHQQFYTTFHLHKAPLNRSGPRACPSRFRRDCADKPMHRGQRDVLAPIYLQNPAPELEFEQ